MRDTEAMWAALERYDRRIGMFLVVLGGFLSMRYGGWPGAAAGFLCAIGGMFRGMAASCRVPLRNDGER